MAQLNVRGIPDDIYQRVRLAAANGGTRIPKGGLERFVVRALRRAVEDPQPGAGLPRLKLCSSCFKVNQVLASAPKPSVVPQSAYEVGPREVVTAEKKPAVELFSHLLDDDDSSAAAAAGMLNELPISHPQMREENRKSDLGADLNAATVRRPAVSAPKKLAEGNGVQGDPATALERASETPISEKYSLEDSLRDAGAVRVSGEGLWIAPDPVAMKFVKVDTSAWRDFSLLSAAKDPWHRKMVGYKTRSAPESEERLCARRGNHMSLNLIDVRELGPGGECYVPDAVISAALDFIRERLGAGDQVLIHCNQGKSRAPSIAFLYMLREGMLPSDAAIPAFKQLYPEWEPSAGFRKYLEIQLPG